MVYCYLCETEWTGYWGEYFCADCENLKRVVKVLGSKKITDNIKYLSRAPKDKRPSVIITGVIMPERPEILEKTISIAEALKVDAIKFEHLNFISPSCKKTHYELCEERFELDNFPELITHDRRLYDKITIEKFINIIQKIMNKPSSPFMKKRSPVPLSENR